MFAPVQSADAPQLVIDVFGSVQVPPQLISWTLSLGLRGHTQLPLLQLDPATPVSGSLQFCPLFAPVQLPVAPQNALSVN
jgi:hypothetical protein